jgi:ribosomal-protein-alanine N-acetyltransferase
VRLVGEQVVLLPAPVAVALAVVRGHGLQDALDALRLTATPGWPHADSADALRPLSEQREDAIGTFLIAVDDEVIGECGWIGGPDADGSVEIGYGLAGPRRGRGLGTEAVGLLSAWVEAQPGVRRVTADVLAGNEPSRRLLTRLGFAETDARPPYVTYARVAPLWTGRSAQVRLP